MPSSTHTVPQSPTELEIQKSIMSCKLLQPCGRRGFSSTPQLRLSFEIPSNLTHQKESTFSPEGVIPRCLCFIHLLYYCNQVYFSVTVGFYSTLSASNHVRSQLLSKSNFSNHPRYKYHFSEQNPLVVHNLIKLTMKDNAVY